MAKIRNFAEIAPNLPFTEYDFYEEYRGAFEKTELGRMKKILPLHEMAESFSLVSKRMAPKRGRRSYFTPEGKVALMFLKMKTQMSFPKLMWAGVVLLLFIVWAVFSTFNLSRRPKYAKMFLEDCAINVELLPKFKVLDHTFQFTGGDDTEEKWEIHFKKPLSEEFLASLNRLCNQNGSNWSYNYREEYYVFSYWHDVEIRETVIIYPKTQSAVLSHVKI